MAKAKFSNIYQNIHIPILIEKGEDGFYVAECPVLEGCYSQGKTLREALKNIREVIELIAEEKEAQSTLRSYRSKELSLHTITL